MLRRLLLAAAVTVMVPLAVMLAPGAANTARAATCIDGVAVTSFAFNPSVVPPTGSSPLTLVLQNCTSQTIQGTTDWFGSYSPGQGCPVSDAVPFNYTIAPNGTYMLTNTFGAPGDFQNCHPTALRMSANVNVNGVVGTVTTVSATLQFLVCTNGIAISQFSFSPPAVQGTQTSTLTLVVQNCGSQAVQGQSIVAPKFTGTGSGLPPGCPVLDPLAFPFSLAAGGSSTSTLGLGNPIASCQATGITATANVTVNGGTGAATATANLVIVPSAPGGCHVTYAPNNWTGGFTANVTIANNGSSAINGWTLTFTFPGDQKITSWWNAAVTQTGANVTATNLSYNATISPGSSQTFGFQGTWKTSDASPASFSVNGVACT